MYLPFMQDCDIIVMTIEFAQIISTLDQRPDTTDPVPVFMDQNDAISGIEHTYQVMKHVVLIFGYEKMGQI
jgi:hypothetical protein